ncbi:25640_t:CDS:2, partial [Gigaspora margarita]
MTNSWRQVPGWHKTFNRNTMKYCSKKVSLYLDEIELQIEIRLGKKVSTSTLWRSLAYYGISQKKYILVSNTKEQLVFLDKSSKDERTFIRGYGYSEINTKAMHIAIDIIENSCTKLIFKEFVITQV